MKTVIIKVEAILKASNTETFVTNRVSHVNVEFGGIPGDRHFGITDKAGVRQPMYERGTEIFNRRQISIVSVEDCGLIAKELGVSEIKPEWLGANILVSGISHFTTLTMGSRFLFPDGTGLINNGENLPCKFPGQEIQKAYSDMPDLAKKFIIAGKKRRGIVCSVERPGKISVNDEIKLLINDYEKPMQ
ncbi:MOSC domain-containing protein [Cytobacillus sp. S13-E01]|uniref:MOSC domain-containing protein n=1 Tax=Cytobacillus sp. S13-E01 TaxID=3031326 RepID=UPI0023D8683A|nr:MOSC domain-containing protein [Cytobacillus sp. S13-E01]MDF0728872.1 MOSC domain-containing protein [Cytobacillus sp. S13-E01]